MGIVLKKASAVLAFVLVALMVISLLPSKANAELIFEVNLSQNFLDSVKMAGSVNGVSYVSKDDNPKIEDGKGYYVCTWAGLYTLEEDLTLDGEAIIIAPSENGNVSFDMKGHTLGYKNSVEYDGDILAAITCKNKALAVYGSGEIQCEDLESPALHTYNDLTVENGKFRGSVCCEGETNKILDGDFYGKLKFKEGADAIIENGLFFDNVTCADEASIHGGVFCETLSLNNNSAIYGGDINELSSSSDLTIENESFIAVTLDSDECGDEPADVVINNGSFAYPSEGSRVVAALTIHQANVTINGGYFKNEINSDAAFANAIECDNSEKGKLVINDGVFIGGSGGRGLFLYENSSAEINGGRFSGQLGGLAGQLTAGEIIGKPDIVIRGGVFEVIDPTADSFSGSIAKSGDKLSGAIIFSGPKAYADSVNAEEFFEALLPVGYSYCPTLEANNTGAKESYMDFAIYTQDLIRVLPEDTESYIIDDSDGTLADEINELIEKWINGEEVAGIDDELAAEIVDAIALGKEVDVSVVISEVPEAEISDDAAIITSSLTGSQNVAAYYKVEIAVIIDGETKGYVTQLDDGILLSLPLTASLPDVASGYTRVYKVARLHNGVLTMLDASRENDTVKAYSDLYSIFAIVYEDTKNVTPSTGDSGYMPWLITLLASAGATAVIVTRAKKLKEEKQ